jgi:hypothetical protein
MSCSLNRFIDPWSLQPFCCTGLDCARDLHPALPWLAAQSALVPAPHAQVLHVDTGLESEPFSNSHSLACCSILRRDCGLAAVSAAQDASIARLHLGVLYVDMDFVSDPVFPPLASHPAPCRDCGLVMGLTAQSASVAHLHTRGLHADMDFAIGPSAGTDHVASHADICRGCGLVIGWRIR